jgi:hypothetical protein
MNQGLPGITRNAAQRKLVTDLLPGHEPLFRSLTIYRGNEDE